ncbi:hypothetical protein PG984_005938 [Apiospora sp. TS-2023a]
MTTDRKEQLYGAPDLKLATADWGGRPLNGAKPTNNQASEDEISPLSTAVVSRPGLAPVCASKTVPTPGWDQDRSGRVNAAQPDAHLNHAPCATATPSGLIAEVRRAVREELFEVMRESQAEGEDNDPEATAEWGDLFTSEGHATPRFGQIMRVLSKHIIRKFKPENDDLIMTPNDLRRFYVEYRLDDEVYPFIEIFSSEAPDMCGRVADFMFFMKCQYHLVQQNEHSRPLVPALTVIGFAQYYMSCILAYPDTEFRRLEKIVADVPSIVVVAGAGGGLSDVNEGKPPPEILPKVIRRHQLPPGADAKSERLLDGAFEDLMYDLDLLPPAPKREPPPPPPPHLQTTTAMVPTLSSSSVAPVQPKTAAAVDKPDSSSATLGHSRSLTRRKYVQPTLLHTIGDDDGAGDDSNTNKSDKSSLDRERELERASMSGPRQGFTRLHSWHADNKSTTGGGSGGLAGVPHRPASEQQQQRHGGRASQPFPPPNAAATAAAGHADNGRSAAGINVPSSAANDTRPPPRGSVSSNASSVGYFGHGGRTPPPTRQNSTSVPDVSSTGRFSFSSSSSSALGMTTPTSASVGSPGGGPASPAASWNPLQYRPTTTAAVAVPGSSRSSSVSGGMDKQQDKQQQQKAHHVRWEGVPQQQPAYAAPTAATFRTGSIGSGGSGGSGQSVKTEQKPSQRRRHGHHRRFPSSGGNTVVGDDDDGGGGGGGGNGNRKGETWEEFLRAQKKGEGYHPR